MKVTLTLIISLLILSISSAQTGNEWVMIPEGSFTPLYSDSLQPSTVDSFYLQQELVTNSEFLAFLNDHPKWKRSNIKSLFAEATYLSHWLSDTVPGSEAPPDSPVVNISWFVAQNYCESLGGRLPKISEWEYVAQASATQPNATENEDFKNFIITAYEKRPSVPLPSVGQTKNYWGISDLHSIVWEWNLDFNAVLISGESRKDSSTDRNLFCAAGSIGVLNPTNYAAFLRYSFRGSLKANYCLKNLGFRCAKDL